MEIDFTQAMADIYKKKNQGEALTDDEMVFWLVHRALVRDDYDEVNFPPKTPTLRETNIG